MHCRDVKDIESIKKKTLTFHAGLGPKIHFGILTTAKLSSNVEKTLCVSWESILLHVLISLAINIRMTLLYMQVNIHKGHIIKPGMNIYKVIYDISVYLVTFDLELTL